MAPHMQKKKHTGLHIMTNVVKSHLHGKKKISKWPPNGEKAPHKEKKAHHMEKNIAMPPTWKIRCTQDVRVVFLEQEYNLVTVHNSA